MPADQHFFFDNNDDGMLSFDRVNSFDRLNSRSATFCEDSADREDANLGELYQDEEVDGNYGHDPNASVDADYQFFEPFAHPRADPEEEIREARSSLKTDICNDNDTDWKNEAAWKTQSSYEGYRTRINYLLKMEQTYLVETPSDQSPTNFLQDVLQNVVSFYPIDTKIQKIKFLLQLIAEIDSTQLKSRYGLRPLHAAAEADIKLFKEGGISNLKPDITIYMCNLMRDQAAAISEVNDAKENILHLALLHDLEGVEDLIKVADQKAFTEQRSPGVDGQSLNPDDGNTPLHDALDFKNFIRPVATCFIPATTKRPPLAPARTASLVIPDSRRLSIAQQVATTSTVPSAPRADQTQQQIVSNQTRPRVLPGRQPQKAGPTACNTCRQTDIQNKAALEKRKAIIRLLLERPGGKDALTTHNSAGLSPYLYLYTSYQKWTKEQGIQYRSSSVNGRAPPPTQGANSATERAPSEKWVGKEGGERTAKNASERDSRQDTYESEKKEAEKKRVEKNQLTQLSDLSSRREGPPTVTTGAQGSQNVKGVKMPVKNTRATFHTKQSLSKSDIGAKDILPTLRERSFLLGGYQNACKCLFRNQSAPGFPPFMEELERQRRFSLSGNQRVRSDTSQNFNFLIFEPMMASVILSLEYTQEILQPLPNGDQEQVERWAKDEENLIKVFHWLKKEKGVKAILNLTVRDNPSHYCSDNTVEECLKDLEVLYLNWNRPDLCANKYTLPPTLVEISLYWSGLNSVLWSWSDTEGLRTLERLQRVYLYVQRGTELENKLRKVKVASFEARVSKWAKQKKPLITVRDDDRPFRDGSGGSRPNRSTIPVHPWRKHVSEFRDKVFTFYRDQASVANRPYHIKIALLDDGVDPTYKRNGEDLHHTGWPSEDSGEPEHGSKRFYVSTNQHGSKMAWLIRQVCPFVTIHVAKLDVTSREGLRQRSFSLEQATKAINWAKMQKVDIISMSWNARRVSPATGSGNDSDIQDLERAIDDASHAGVLMFGAACDVKQSSSSDKWVPCDHKNVFSIGATDMDFDVKKYVDMTKKVDYLFPGEHILSQIEDAEAGNSGATALATGLAALILFCLRIGGRSPPADRYGWIKKVFAKVFDAEANKKVVHVKDVLQIDEQGGVQLLAQKLANL